MRASALVTDRRPLLIVFAQGDLNIVYKPSAINAVQEEREIADKGTGRSLLAVNRSLIETIVSWDLEADDGSPLPLTEASLAPLGLDVTQHIYNEIIRDVLPNQKRASSSRDGSQAASSAPAPTGT